MSARVVPNFDKLEIGLGAFVAIAAQLALIALLSAGEADHWVAEISDENSKPMAVAITPVLDEPPLPKLGGKKPVSQLPDMWKKKASATATKKEKGDDHPVLPSTAADASVAAIPDAAITEAGLSTEDASIGLIQDAPPNDPNYDEAGSAFGSPDGSPDVLGDFSIQQYKNDLSAWFNGHFHPPTSIPCDELKTLKATTSVTVSPDRQVIAHSVSSSGNAEFDAEVEKTLSAIQSNGDLLHAPPSPEVFSKPLNFGFYGKKACK